MAVSMELVLVHLICAAVVAHLTSARTLPRILYQVLGGRKVSEVSEGLKEGREVCDGRLPTAPA